MEYISAILITIFYLIPFAYLIDIIFNLIQIPFAIAGKVPVYVIMLYKTYLTCQFFNFFAHSYVDNNLLNPFPFLIVYSIILLFLIGAPINNEHDNANRTYIFISMCISIPILWLIYFFNISVLAQPVEWFAELIKLMLQIPVIGNILEFILNALSGGLAIVFIIIVAILMIVGIYKVIAIFQKEEN